MRTYKLMKSATKFPSKIGIKETDFAIGMAHTQMEPVFSSNPVKMLLLPFAIRFLNLLSANITQQRANVHLLTALSVAPKYDQNIYLFF